ncbi:MAG: hypothetical protein ACXADA_22320 [Candidatus Hodarchaeales archaeon]|jgi:hypothetical protein
MITQQTPDTIIVLSTYLSLVVMLIAIVIYFILARKLYKNFKETGSEPSKYLTWFFICTPSAIFFLILELAVLRFLVPEGITDFTVQSFNSVTRSVPALAGLPAGTESTLILVDFLGWLFATIAIFLSSLSTVFANLFALSFLDKKWRKTVIIPGFLAFVYWLFHTFGGFISTEYAWHWIQEYLGGAWDMSYTATTELIHMPLVMLPLVISVLILFYVAWKVRVKGRPAFLRALLIGVGFLLLSSAYFVEVLEPHPLIVAMSRLVFVYFPFHMTVCLIPPLWFKRLIGMPTS